MSLTRSQKKAQNKYYDTHKNDPLFKNKLKEKNKKEYLKRKQKNTSTTTTTTTTIITNPIQNPPLTQFIKCECGKTIQNIKSFKLSHYKSNYHIEKTNQKTEPISIPIVVPIVEKENWIYLMRFSEIITGSKMNYDGSIITNYFEKKYIYKPGKSNQEHVEDRCRMYKGYCEPIRLFSQYVENALETERKILSILRNTKNIKQCSGNEYFETDDEKLILKIMKDNSW
jgi:hypothetical protein